MSTPLVCLVTGIYFAVGIMQATKGNPGGCLMWLSYGTANLGLLWAGVVK